MPGTLRDVRCANSSGTGEAGSDPVPMITVGTPEPASFAMLGLGLAGVGAFTAIRRRGRKSA